MLALLAYPNAFYPDADIDLKSKADPGPASRARATPPPLFEKKYGLCL